MSKDRNLDIARIRGKYVEPVSEMVAENKTRIEDLGINVKDFGAKGDGVTDDSQAIKKAIEKAMTTNPSLIGIKPAVFFPTGIYIIKSNKIFSDFNIYTGVREGISFLGVNRRSSVLKLTTEGQEKWFYDNESITTQKFSRLYFEHLGFETDDVEKGNGFKMWSQGGEKQFKFFSCEFNLATIMQNEGIGNSDLNRFLMCSITANENAFILNNNQAVNNELFCSDVNLKKGFVEVKNGGGGSFKIFGGNFEMHPHLTDITDHYLFSMGSDPILGQGNCDFNFNDIRFEMHGVNKKLVKTTENTKPLNVNFTRCQFGTVTGGSREVVHVFPTKRVLFENCILNDNFTYKAEGVFSTSGGSPSGSQILFLNCDVGRNINLHERVTLIGDLARVIADNCVRQSSSTSPQIKVQDFDFGWLNISPCGIAPKAKISPVKQSWITFPTSAGTGIQLIIPNGCYITRIYIKKPGVPSTSLDYNLKIGNDDKTITLGSSGLKAFNLDHIIDVKDIGVLPYNLLRMWGEGTATVNQSGGTAYIEYI